jgi:hypothetical protein
MGRATGEVGLKPINSTADSIHRRPLVRYAETSCVCHLNAEYLHERLPKSKLDLIEALHFIWEDAADTYAALITNCGRVVMRKPACVNKDGPEYA